MRQDGAEMLWELTDKKRGALCSIKAPEATYQEVRRLFHIFSQSGNAA